MPAQLPDTTTRWRCARCGNLTRFDVLRTVRSSEYVHQGLDGAPVVEERKVLAETVDRVSCRWCGAADTVELVARPGGPAGER